jgi:hypothetical protein
MHFLLSGNDLQPEQITKALGISPSEAWMKGDKPRSDPSDTLRLVPKPFGRWSLIPACSIYDDFDTQIRKLLGILESLPPIISQLIEKYNGEISVGYASGEENFGFHLSRDLLQRLSRLGVSLDFDIYSIHEHDDTD